MSRESCRWRLARKAVADIRNLSAPSLTALAMTCGCLVLMILSSACGLGGSGIRWTVPFDSKSPDGATTAVLVNRYYDSGPDPYQFLVTVVPSSETVSKALKDKYLWKYVVLMGERPGDLQLQWRDNATLVVSCNGCQVRPQDLRRKKDNSGSVSIVYEGFPEQPAPTPH